MQKQCIFILGMHRSGTSAVTRAINLMGAALGDAMLPPAADNPEGFWEHQELVEIDEKILKTLGIYWDSTQALPEQWWKRPELEPLKAQARKFLKTEFGSSPLFALKDPRLCRLMPFWLEILRELEIQPQILFVFRSPWEIAGSLARREPFAVEKTLLLWAWHLLDAEAATRDLPRTAITYDDMLADPVKTLAALPVAFPKRAEAEIRASIKPGMRHHQSVETPKVVPFLKHLVERLEALQPQLAANINPTAFHDLRAELAEKLHQAGEMVGFWHEDAMRWRHGGDLLHERSLKIIDLEKDVVSLLNEGDRLRLDMHALGTRIEGMKNDYLMLKQEFEYLGHQHELMTQGIIAMRNSTSWKITAPLRRAMLLLRSWRKFLNPGNYRLALNIIRENGFLAFREVSRELLEGREAVAEQLNYPEWILRYETMTHDRQVRIGEKIEGFDHQPLISVLMPVYNVEEKWLRLAVESVQKQIYPHWELCIADDASPAPHIRPLLEELAAADSRIKVLFREKNGHISESSNSALKLATGEFVALMDHDDVISEEALFWVADEINRHPDVQMIYSDEDKIDPAGNRYSAYFKSDWNTDLFYAHNMFSHLGVYKRSLMEKVGGFRKGFEGSQDYDLALRCLEQVQESQIRHIPRVLYHWRSIPGSTSIALAEKNYAGLAALKALREHFARFYPDKKMNLRPTLVPGSQRIVWPLPAKLPLVSLVIPTRNGVEILSVCIESILKKTLYPNYEILIVDNQSDDPATLAFFEKIVRAESRVRVVKYDQPFNYSAINNFAIAQTKGEIIGLINNDIEAMDGPEEDRCWLMEMVSHALRPDVGAVGAKLYYPNGTVQHGGVLTGLGGPGHAVAGHLFVSLTKDDAGYFARAIITQQLSGVTAACMIMRREVFDEVGGLDAENLPVAFNDVDLCLKIRKAGYKIIWSPYAEMIHHESVSRGREDTPEKKARAAREVVFMRKKWGEFLLVDPYYNPNLDYIRGNFGLAFPPRTLLS